MPDTPPLMLTPKDVARACDVHPDTVLRWIRKKNLPALTHGVGGGYRLTVAEVVAWCSEHRVAILNPFGEQSQPTE